MDILALPLRGAEFLAVDVETNGKAGDVCELTEVGAVLVGGGELHERFSSLVRVRRPLSRGIQRFTGISQAMLDEAPDPQPVLREVCERLRGRVLVAHSASFDRRVLRAAFGANGVPWPDPPTLCTVSMARRFAPLAAQRKLAPLAASLGIDVDVSHRALADAVTCARVFCALFGRLCAHASTVGEAVALLASGRRPRRRRPARTLPAFDGSHPVTTRVSLDFGALPAGPGVYLFRDSLGRVLYVGKSVNVRARARTHFRPGAERPDWAPHAQVVDARATHSELGALVLESRLIKELRPPGNALLKGVDSSVYVRCRLDIPFPVLEVAREPAVGHGVTIGPLRGRAAAAELVEQLNSLFGLRHCGRKLPRRQWPSAYGQMGRCLSPCLGDLDPNLYRRRLDEALRLFCGARDGRGLLLAHVEAQMREAARQQRFERAAWLHRRHRRLSVLLDRLGGVLAATHARPRLVLAGEGSFDAFWVVAGRIVDWGPLPDPEECHRRTLAALRYAPGPGTGIHLPAGEVDEVRIAGGWLAAHPEAPGIDLDPPPSAPELSRFAAAAAAEVSERPSRRSGGEHLAPLEGGGPGVV
ncbi:MAG: exonuclease domain-containing protein [Solirubrobacteraceae bacterium]